MLHVQCKNCGTFAITINNADPDAAVVCTTGEGEPEGSVEGSCCSDGHTHEEHAEYARTTGDANCRPVTITVMPGPGAVSITGGAALQGESR